MLKAVDVATQTLAKIGGGIVSMSWGTPEFSQETSTSNPNYDGRFNNPSVTYLAAAGDSAGTLWPSVSPNVIAVGGTSIVRDPASGAYQFERAWQQTGGGVTQYEQQPRNVPDIAADANPATGVWVYSQWACTFIDLAPAIGFRLEGQVSLHLSRPGS